MKAGCGRGLHRGQQGDQIFSLLPLKKDGSEWVWDGKFVSLSVKKKGKSGPDDVSRLRNLQVSVSSRLIDPIMQNDRRDVLISELECAENDVCFNSEREKTWVFSKEFILSVWYRLRSRIEADTGSMTVYFRIKLGRLRVRKESPIHSQLSIHPSSMPSLTAKPAEFVVNLSKIRTYKLTSFHGRWDLSDTHQERKLRLSLFIHLCIPNQFASIFRETRPCTNVPLLQCILEIRERPAAKNAPAVPQVLFNFPHIPQHFFDPPSPGSALVPPLDTLRCPIPDLSKSFANSMISRLISAIDSNSGT
ncbi:hypothetical protein B0H13DRAFT_1850876 [Mycena leptocephala]|nr:hypothetical protein B0H13DRAFT_1850876 [Mycena leptocephala]